MKWEKEKTDEREEINGCHALLFGTVHDRHKDLKSLNEVDYGLSALFYLRK